MDVAVELSRIVISETSPQQVIFLREKGGERNFPIVIGIGEALAIDRRLKGVEMPRPLTHDLLASIIQTLGGELEKIVITDIREHTFFATIFISQNGQTVEIDSRPSDAIALGVAFDTPIFVADHVFEAVLDKSFSLSAQKESLALRREDLCEQIDAVREQLSDHDFRASASKDEVRDLRGQLQEMQTELVQIDEILRQLP